MLLSMQLERWRKWLNRLIQSSKTLPKMGQRKMKNIKEGLQDMEERMRQSNKCLVEVAEGKSGRKAICEGMVVDNFPKLMKGMNLQVQRAQQTHIQ